MATQIIYNGTVIGTVDAGQSKILKCNGKKMKSDVEIRAGERTEIKYDGAVIATVEAGSSKTIKCAGKTMKSNIEIRVEDDTPGKEGVSPTVEMIDIEGGTRIIITDVNGPKSTDIMDGKDGKSAYQYAQEGGYSGTEEEFYAKLAEESGEFEEIDPTVPDWAKQPEKPKYTADEVGALPKDTEIPAKTSDISNDSGFITRTVGDLANYYLKSETLTKTEINALVSAIPKFAIQVVNSLPTTDISTTTVYLLKSGIESDLYTEYIYVNGNWEVLGSQRVDLTGYATENWVNIQLSAYLKSNELASAINAALAQAKASGEFDGKDGDDGKDGYTPQKGVDYFDGKNGSDGVGIKSVVQTTTSSLDGGSNVITVTKTDNTTSTFTVKNGREGSDGKDGYTPIKGVDYFDGTDGEDGKTPVKGVDYYTEADKAEIVAAVIESLGGNPIFGIVDENNNIIVNGDLPDGTYTVKYEMEGGKIINIGNLVLDSNVYYTVTKNLTNCTISNSATQSVQGGSYSATITANDGFELKSVTATMGGSAVSVSGGVINIASVTGDIVITAIAETFTPSYTNLFVQGGDGYILNGRCSSTGANRTDANGCIVSNYIKVANGDTVYVNTMIGLNFSGFKLAGGGTAGEVIPSGSTYIKNYAESDGIWQFTINNESVEYVRIMIALNANNIAISETDVTNAGIIITVNEPIV